MRNLIKPSEAQLSATNSDWLMLKDSDSGKEALHRCPSVPFYYAKTSTLAKDRLVLWVWDRIANRYDQAAGMRYIRYYDKLVLTGLSKLMLRSEGLIWLNDNEQWVTDDDYEAMDDRCVIGDSHYASVPGDAIYSEPEGEYIWDSDAVRLEDCEEYCSRDYASNNFYYSERDDSWYRYEDNMPEYGETNSNLRDYGDKADDLLGFGDDDDCLILSGKPLFLGVELEVNAKYDRNELAEAITSREAICKEDGSLDSDEGLEIVTKPMSLSDTSEFIARLIRNCASDIKAPQQGYGLHVHISKNCLPKRAQARLAAFIGNKEHYDYLLAFSRRPSMSNYAKFGERILYNTYFFSRSRSTKNKPLSKHKAYKKVGEHERYSALNFENPATIEFRFFNTSKDTQEIMQSVEFCQAIAHYIVETIDSPAKQVLTIDAFNKWVLHNELYPHYNKFINPLEQKQLELIAA